MSLARLHATDKAEDSIQFCSQLCWQEQTIRSLHVTYVIGQTGLHHHQVNYQLTWSTFDQMQSKIVNQILYFTSKIKNNPNFGRSSPKMLLDIWIRSPFTLQCSEHLSCSDAAGIFPVNAQNKIPKLVPRKMVSGILLLSVLPHISHVDGKSSSFCSLTLLVRMFVYLFV